MICFRNLAQIPTACVVCSKHYARVARRRVWSTSYDGRMFGWQTTFSNCHESTLKWVSIVSRSQVSVATPSNIDGRRAKKNSLTCTRCKCWCHKTQLRKHPPTEALLGMNLDDRGWTVNSTYCWWMDKITVFTRAVHIAVGCSGCKQQQPQLSNLPSPVNCLLLCNLTFVNVLSSASLSLYIRCNAASPIP